MSVFRRKLICRILAKKKIPIWDGTSLTPMLDIDGYYIIDSGATLKGFIALLINKKRGKIINDFALNDDYDNYSSWDTSPPPNLWNPTYTKNSAYLPAEINGQGHTIYGLYGNIPLFPWLNYDVSSTFSVHDLRLKCAYRPSVNFSWVSGFLFYSNMQFTSLKSLYNIEIHGIARALSGSIFATVGLGGQIGNGATGANVHSILVNATMTGSQYYPSGCGLEPTGTSSSSIKNMGFIGTCTTVTGGGYYAAGIISGYDGRTVNIDNAWTSSIVYGGWGSKVLSYNKGTITNGYYDSTIKLPATVAQGTAKTTDEIKSQAFVDLLNANLPAGCTPWKLGLDGYPTLDF